MFPLLCTVRDVNRDGELDVMFLSMNMIPVVAVLEAGADASSW
jgi:hypothetical protein